MNDAGYGARQYLDFLNQTVVQIQILFKVELTKDEQMALRLKINDAIAQVITDEVIDR